MGDGSLGDDCKHCEGTGRKDGKQGKEKPCTEEAAQCGNCGGTGGISLANEGLLRVAKTIANGLKQMHDNGMIHLDVKPDNILCIGSTFKLCDLGQVYHLDITGRVSWSKTQGLEDENPFAHLGLARSDSEERYRNIVQPGTPKYRAPELNADETDFS